MILKLPLTLAIIQSLLVTVGQGAVRYTPGVVVETLKINKSEIKTIERQEVLKLRNEVLSLLRMADFYKVRRAGAGEPLHRHRQGRGEKLSLIVDTLLGQEEIVIKPLGNCLKTQRISGATSWAMALSRSSWISPLWWGTTKNPLIRDSHDDAREFVRLIGVFGDSGRGSFKVGALSPERGWEFLEETLSILLSRERPFSSKTYTKPSAVVLLLRSGNVLAYLKRPPPLKLFHQALGVSGRSPPLRSRRASLPEEDASSPTRS